MCRFSQIPTVRLPSKLDDSSDAFVPADRPIIRSRYPCLLRQWLALPALRAASVCGVFIRAT
jgi:hypothetical protein